MRDLDKGAIISILSGFAGTIIGGIITWFVTKYSLDKQLSNEKILREEEYIHEQNVAIRLVANEVRHNVTNLIAIKNMIIQDNLKNTVLLEDLSKLICKDYWDEYKFILWNHKDSKAIEKIEYFYYNLSLEIYCKVTDLERIKERLSFGIETLDYIEKYLK